MRGSAVGSVIVVYRPLPEPVATGLAQLTPSEETRTAQPRGYCDVLDAPLSNVSRLNLRVDPKSIWKYWPVACDRPLDQRVDRLLSMAFEAGRPVPVCEALAVQEVPAGSVLIAGCRLGSPPTRPRSGRCCAVAVFLRTVR